MRPASASTAGSASSSPGRAPSAGSSGFSSAPINPVVPSSHSRRRKSDGAWLNGDAQDKGVGSPSSSGTQDEDIRVKPVRPSSASSSSSSSGSSAAKQAADDDARANPSQSQSQSQTLPSLSSGSAALLQLRDRQRPSQKTNSPPSMDTGEASGQSTQPPRSGANASSQQHVNTLRRTAREQGNPLIPDEDMLEDEDDLDDAEEDEPSAPPSPSDQREVRILFHGREIFAVDLIGLRVAKTFAGHGRFLGQVVKFDKRVALYTVVYADGDAEDLTVDGTLQILIQDEIERADPSQPPAAISLLLKKGEDGSSPASPDTGDFLMAPPPPTGAPRHTCIQVSDREAQFVVSLFENHALPSLVRQGWRVQTSNSARGETLFVSPSGEIFPSVLDVVGYIASDNELLTACFPANVHSAILSLLPREAAARSVGFTDTGSSHGSTGSASRKRTTSDSSSAQQFDGKRTRHAREEAFERVDVPLRGGMGRGGDTALYRHEHLDRRAEAASRTSAYRSQGMGGRIRMSGDRFVGGETTSAARIQAPPDLRGYRRPSNRDPPLENPFSSRWSGGEPAPGRVESAEYVRRFADSPGWRERGDAFGSDRQLEAHPRNRIRAEGRYIHRLSARNPVDLAGGGALSAASGIPMGYYRDSTGSSPGGQASPMTNGLTYPQYSTIRARAGDYSRTSGAPPRVSRETASFMSPSDTLGASAAFSMVDVDRIPKSRPDSAEQPRGRSPRQSEAQQAYLQHQQSLQHHRRSNSGHSFHSQRGSENHYSAEPTSEAQKEQHSSAMGGTISAASQQPHE
ncbi:hypothetical protein PHYPSEUDO_005589 [Phytophthora pseudosyringae]|uniref:PTM/DIR17-like Tudor domain-containing protein n=1 Tax=Phytophthora pseudosyringae TaxID=221518 RepID=A0A8T1WF75_9STRA|nr:hypothetical protein PHYPSEUDO_005589 [Phytophthora pseudosyringae]